MPRLLALGKPPEPIRLGRRPRLVKSTQMETAEEISMLIVKG